MKLKNIKRKWRSEGCGKTLKYILEMLKARFDNKIIRIKNNISSFIDRLYFSEVNVSDFNEKLLYIYSPVWGDKFLELFFNYNIPSVIQEGNFPRLKNDGYNLVLYMYTEIENIDMIYINYEREIKWIKDYATLKIIPMENYQGKDRNELLFNSLIKHIEKCIDDRAIMINNAPDSLWGNNSIWNAIKIGENKGVCVGSGGCRISLEAINDSDELHKFMNREATIENDQLVDLAIKYSHSSLYKSFDNNKNNATYCGISIRQISTNIYSVIHNLPSVDIIKYLDQDLVFFNNSKTYNSWDKTWTRFLLKENRVKIIGSSDLVFKVEITSNKQHSAVTSPDLLNNDKYLTRNKRHLQHYVCNSFVCSWRGRG